MNFDLDRPWISLTVREMLVIERAWGWTTAMAQLVVVAGVVFVARKVFNAWRARRAARAVVPDVGPEPDVIASKPCPVCFLPIAADLATYYEERLARAVELDRRLSPHELDRFVDVFGDKWDLPIAIRVALRGHLRAVSEGNRPAEPPKVPLDPADWQPPGAA